VALVPTIAANLATLRGRIEEAASRSGRHPASVTLVAVTKYVGCEVAAALIDAGCRELGESRPQELWEKADLLSDRRVHWHLVGHLQRNKVRRTVPLTTLIHSVDSERLMSEIDRVAAEQERSVRVLLEVNVSEDSAKHGFRPDELGPLLAKLPGFQQLEVCGLMAMASLEGGPDTARRDFRRLRELRDHLRDNCPPAVRLEELSMGMSGDFEVAIEEGATIVRVGSALFEGIEK
jgi:pyridoxal phosphate enzyme (YggS family)